MSRKNKKVKNVKKKSLPKLSGTLKMVFPPRTQIEIVRSFSFKKNLGNYEMADFFCSEKVVCDPEDAEKMSDALYQFCKKEVAKSVAVFGKKVDNKKIKDASKDEAENDAGSIFEVVES